MPLPNWYQVLEAARRLAAGDDKRGRERGEGFTSKDLAVEAWRRRIMPTQKEQKAEDLRATRIASAWCHKLRKWGYLATIFNTEGQRRWSRIYTVTRAGLKAKEPVSRRVYAPADAVPKAGRGRPR